MRKIKISGGIAEIGNVELALDFDLQVYEPCNWVIQKIKSDNQLIGIKSTIHVDYNGNATITPLRE